MKLLRRYARKLVLAFDADSAGQAAAERFYQWEKEHDLEVTVADLPAGVDPADLASTDPERLARPSRRRCRSSSSGSTACSAPPTSAPPRGGRAPPRPPST